MADQSVNDHSLRRCGSDGAGHGGGEALLPAYPFYAPRYHFGMLLGVDDFEAEQAYHRGKVRLHNGWLHREGVVWGFRVELTRRRGVATGELRVLPGLALDPAGRELHLDEPVCLSLPAWYEAHRREVKEWHDAHREELREPPDAYGAEAEEGAGAAEPGDAEPYAGGEEESEPPDGAGEEEARAYPRPEPRAAADGVTRFWAHVVARFAACEARPVPAIAEPCADLAAGEVACSRAEEHVELYLVPGRPPRHGHPYHRLRLLFGVAEPRREGGAVDDADREVLEARAEVLAHPVERQPRAYLRWFRRFAALDELDLAPEPLPGGGLSLFPWREDGDDRAGVVLATVEVALKPGRDGRPAFAGAEVDNTVRPAHVATSTLQELLCGPILGGAGPHDAGGPRIIRHTLRVQERERRISMRAHGELARGSVRPEAFSVSSYNERGGWHDVDVNEAGLHADRHTVHLRLASGFGGFLVRVIARGTGPSPLLGTNLVPLAGGEHSPPGSKDDGHDFVAMHTLAPPKRSKP